MRVFNGADLDKIDKTQKRKLMIRKEKSIQKANEKWMNNETNSTKKKKHHPWKDLDTL